jgi:hypothetical protein
MSPPPSTRPTGNAPDRKSVLFCPRCEHESPPEGDWTVHAVGDSVVVRCPVCGERVARRPCRGEHCSRPRTGLEPVLQAGRAATRSAHIATDWAEVWRSFSDNLQPTDGELAGVSLTDAASADGD